MKSTIDWDKIVKKGLEGALIGGGAGICSQDVIITVVTAIGGFLFRAVRNWWKHK